MKMKMHIMILAVLLCCGMAGVAAEQGRMEATDLRCEYLKEPLGIDVARPRLSWRLESAGRGQRQSAYQVLVASSPKLLAEDKGDLWDSGKVASDQSLHVEYSGKTLASCQECYWKVRIWSGQGQGRSAWSEAGAWTMGLRTAADWQAKWITYPRGARLSHPWLRQTFDCPEKITRAIVHVDTASFYELHVNGKKVGPWVLTPGISQNNKRFFVNSYDVTSLLVKGKNCIALWMGPGWYQPRMGNRFNAPILRAQLNICSPSGSTVVGTDAGWRVKESCISQIGQWCWSNFGGENFDAREFIADWDQVGLDDSTWLKAREIVTLPPEISHSWLPCEGAKLDKPVRPVGIRQLDNLKWVIDFGKPLTGWMRLKMHDLKPGQNVTINYADLANRSKAFSVNPDGFQDFKQKDVFVSAGQGEETYCPRFNYHSFQYAIIDGLTTKPELGDAEAVMIEPDFPDAGAFECSNDLFNRICETTRYTLRTQNPCLALGTGEAREKSAYGDGGAHLSGYIYNFQCAANLRKWICDWSDAQREDGWFHHTAPAFEDHGGGPSWGGQVSELVRRMILYYGDTGIVDQMYDRLRKYVDFIESKTQDDILRAFSPTKRRDIMFLGDWARPASKPVNGFNIVDSIPELEFFNNCYRVLLWQELHDFAASIGRAVEVRRCGERLAVLRPLIHKTYFQEDKGKYIFSDQSHLAMALYAHIPPPELRTKIMAQLENEIVVAKQGHLATGLLGTFLLFDLLIQEGRNDLAALIMGQTTYPGWGYLLKELDLKTWPETWSGYGSQVILVTATPGSWFYEGLAGIRPDPSAPGFKHFFIRPGVVDSVDWVRCHYDSSYGRIVSNWKRDGQELQMDVIVPPNSTATVYVPAQDAAGVCESDKPAIKADGVKFLKMDRGAAVYEVSSGVYHFRSQTRNEHR